MYKFCGTLAAGVMAAFIASPAWAAIIFQDNFNRANSNSVGNGWFEIEDERNDVRVRNNQLRLRDNRIGIDAAAARSGLSTIGLTNITLKYDWAALRPSDRFDDLYVGWRVGGGSWTTIAHHGLGGNGSFSGSAASLGLRAANAGNLQIAFWTDVSWYDEGAKIDNVKLTGDPATAVPEPGSVALLGIGLLGLSYLGRRRDA